MQLLSFESASPSSLTDVELKKQLNDDSSASPTLFTVLLCILYLIFKLNQVYGGLNDLGRSIKELLGDFVSEFFFINNKFFIFQITLKPYVAKI